MSDEIKRTRNETRFFALLRMTFSLLSDGAKDLRNNKVNKYIVA